MSNKSGWIQVIAQTVKRFGQDLVGLLLISISIISILSLFGLTKGYVVQLWSTWINIGFGAGSSLFFALIFFIGLLILIRHIEKLPEFDLKRIIYLEIALFSLIGFLSIINGFSIERAHSGLDGGIIGWGIAYIFVRFLGLPISASLLFFFTFYFLSSGIGMLDLIQKKVDNAFTNLLSTPRSPSTIYKDKLATPNIKEKIFSGKKKELPLVNQPAALDLPGIDLLLNPQKPISDDSYIHTKAIQIEKTLEEFGVPARVAGYRVGPTVIQYAVEPGYIEKVNEEGDVVRKKVRVAQISTLNRDLALALSVDRLRIEAPIPGHSFVGIEIPSQTSTVVRLKSLLNSEEFHQMNTPLKLGLGLDVSGDPVLADLSRMPHLLIAGTTGSGKSVCITSFITCLIMNNSPDELKIAILDPKMVELVRFNGLPHLLGKVETQIDRMLGILAWAVKEMDDRYRLMESINARDLDSYNLKIIRRGRKKLPKIIIFIDELADLMSSAPDQTEGYLVRLAQMARATGMHLIVATQRPSTDIITGLIKANFPARLSFLMATSTDSRVVLDTNGAETLMGRGDMLFLNPEITGLSRAQGVMVDDQEIENVIKYWQDKVTLTDNLEDTTPWEDLIPSLYKESDELLNQAIEITRNIERVSTSWLQRKLRIGFPRAARLMNQLEEFGIVSPLEPGERDREVYPFNNKPDE